MHFVSELIIVGGFVFYVIFSLDWLILNFDLASTWDVEFNYILYIVYLYIAFYHHRFKHALLTTVNVLHKNNLFKQQW